MASSSPQRGPDTAKPASSTKRASAAKDPERRRAGRGQRRRSGLDEIRRTIDTLASEPDADQALVAVVGEVLSSQANWKSLRPSIEGLMRAAQLAPVVEAALLGDVASRAIGLDRLGDDLVARARITGEAKRSLVTDDKLLTGAAVSELLGSRSENPRQYANRLRQAGDVLAIPSANQYVYPAFQFDVRRKTVYPEIAMVGRLLDAVNDPWGVLSWWQSPNARIGDRRPRELLGTPEARQLRSLAEAVVEPVG